MKFFYSYLASHKNVIRTFVVIVAVFSCSFLLYRLPVRSVIYPSVLSLLAGCAIFWFDYNKALRKHKELERMSRLSAELIESFPCKTTYEDEDYRRIIEMLTDEYRYLETDMNGRYEDMIEYYTMWVHQIKMPIASMRLSLQGQDSQLSRKLAADLFRIEQYVEMVMMFLRLNSDHTDYVIEACDIDRVIKQSVKKFSSEFIQRRIALNYEPVEAAVITDEKWLSFVIEQLLSNALKYTKEGSISVFMEKDILYIKDTGIGIAKEDLPRIFEKGYTGYNGRRDKRASGIGLYLVKRICDNLNHKIKISSVAGEGTTAALDLSRDKLTVE